jgi:zinc protease
MRAAGPLPRQDPRTMTRRTLPNGLPVVLQPAPPGSVTMAATWITEGGTARDPPGAEGMAMALGQWLLAGTKSLDKRALARVLDESAGSLGCEPSWEALEVHASGPAAAETRLLKLVAEVVSAPRFDAKELARVVRQQEEAILRQRSQPEERAERALLEAVFPPGHPYRRNPLGRTPLSRSLSRDALEGFHRRHLPTRGGRLVITSPRPVRDLWPLVEATFGRLELGPECAPPPIVRRARGGTPGRTYVPLPGTVQVEVLLGCEVPPRRHPDFPALYLANEVLGGRPTISRLFQVVRERKGYTYGAGSELECLRWGGLFTAQAGTDPAHRRVVEDLLWRELRRLASGSLRSRELGTIRESLLGSLPLLWESARQAHGMALTVAYFDLPNDHYWRWPEALRAVSAEEVTRAAQRHWVDPGGLVIVASGPPLPLPAGPPRPRPGRASGGAAPGGASALPL